MSLNVLAKNRRNWHVNFIDSGFKVAKTRFQTFFRDKSALFKWKCQVQRDWVGVCVCVWGGWRKTWVRVYSSIFYILSNFHTLTSESMYYIQYLTSCIVSCMAKSYMLYSILYLVSTIFNIVNVYSTCILCLRF